ncbi:MAG: fimbrillin family protein [Muribaculaceae bacterium]|nr:fimbrillin family protein [Muribaculaceae bacterium]
MKSTKIAFISLAAAMAFAACDSVDQEIAQEKSNIIRISAIHPSAASRASDAGFDKGDQIGLFVVDAETELQPGGNMVNNGCFEYNGSSWAAANNYFWNEGSYNVYAYYPYAKRVDDTENYSFELPEDQSTEEGFSSADFLWAKAENQKAGTTPVSLMFSHCLSNVEVLLTKAEDYGDGDIPEDAQVFIHGTYTAANIDLSNGGATADSNTNLGSIKAKKTGDKKYSAIVVPQRISSRRPLVEVVCGNVSYIMEGQLSFKPGYRHTITVTLSKSPEQVEIEIGGSIGGWN